MLTIVPDPYYGGSEGFEYVLDILEDACGGVTAELFNPAALHDTVSPALTSCSVFQAS